MLRLQEEEIFARLATAREAVDPRRILTVLNPASGPLALVSHLANVRERVDDVGLILRRLFDGLDEMDELRPAELEEGRGVPAGTPFYAPVKARTHDIGRLMKVDYESLFHFGSVLLDQWGYVSGYLASCQTPIGGAFHGFCQEVESALPPPQYQPIKTLFLREIRWLHFWMRSFRNKFVVHEDRPVQQSRIYSHGEFALFRPAHVGWNDDAALGAEALALLPYAPEAIQRLPPTHWQRERPRALLEVVIRNIGSVDQQSERERIANIATRMGYTTPTFQVIASVLADFVARATPMLIDAALLTPTEINLGAPPTRPTVSLEP